MEPSTFHSTPPTQSRTKSFPGLHFLKKQDSQKRDHLSFLHRLFHTTQKQEKNITKPANNSILYSEDSEDSDGGANGSTTTLPITPLKENEVSPPMQYTPARTKSQNHLSDFFSKKENKKTSVERASQKFIFWHLKPYTENQDDSIVRNTSELSLCEKYGWVEKKCIGRGSNGVVKISHLKQTCGIETLYAIKEFKKSKPGESDKTFIKKLTSEFCISSSLHHENVIETVDLIRNENNQWCGKCRA